MGHIARPVVHGDIALSILNTSTVLTRRSNRKRDDGSVTLLMFHTKFILVFGTNGL